jgi:c-di-GMP-binding flagellar brake protein YcgR
VKKSPGRRDMRKFERKPAELAVTVRAAGNRVEAGIRLDSADFSEGGAFLRSELLFEVGETLHLEIPLPSGQTVKATGRVVRVSRSRGRETLPGMGIEFTRLALHDRRAIAASLADLARRAS